ncbi:MAG: hypothetical protein V3W02_00945 [Gammaproteobacteria bacterium]
MSLLESMAVAAACMAPAAAAVHCYHTPADEDRSTFGLGELRGEEELKWEEVRHQM